ncbi:hypothetical protein [Corynebacterium guangdongense]|uniref:Very-short-patch-repair endonuclease n=1 Tax=Corynebacterium guangdongense TaxID=1783348 RepID=A0ABU1ZU02_9CORY|nr:hypothetical protein [Corynebacterium guangdongense]MDR7328411.1 very-short-patch-repair endonuclease [Corynebacterium guangdongense]WJZ16988.1 hypothetical protein CGUA_01940 [Corynebacterium guangdongense]
MDVPTLRSTHELVGAARNHLPAHARNDEVDASIAEHYTRASPDLWVPNSSLRPPGLVRRESAHHPRGLGYRVPARVRALAHLQERPDWVADGFSAAALHGFGAFSESSDTMLLGVTRKRLASRPEQATTRRLHDAVRTRFVSVEGRHVLVVDRGTAIAHCLRDIRAGAVSWPITRGLAFHDTSIRAIQFLDHVLDRTTLTAEDIRGQCAGLVDSRWLRRMVASTSQGMESPPETLLRLVVRNHGDFEPQVPVHDGGLLITRADQADRRRRVALFYDGEHHLDRRQRDKDTAITRTMHRLGWTVVRLTATDLADAGRVIEAIRVSVQNNAPRTPRDYAIT